VVTFNQVVARSNRARPTTRMNSSPRAGFFVGVKQTKDAI